MAFLLVIERVIAQAYPVEVRTPAARAPLPRTIRALGCVSLRMVAAYQMPQPRLRLDADTPFLDERVHLLRQMASC